MSLHALGADVSKVIQVRVNNPLELAKAQGGPTGAFAAWAVPQTITNIVYNKMVDGFKTKFKEQGVDADVSIVADTDAVVVKGSKDLATGVVLGVALVGAAWAAWKFGIKKLLGGLA